MFSERWRNLVVVMLPLNLHVPLNVLKGSLLVWVLWIVRHIILLKLLKI